MKKSKFSEEQIAYALRQAVSGTAEDDLSRADDLKRRPRIRLGPRRLPAGHLPVTHVSLCPPERFGDGRVIAVVEPVSVEGAHEGACRGIIDLPQTDDHRLCAERHERSLQAEDAFGGAGCADTRLARGQDDEPGAQAELPSRRRVEELTDRQRPATARASVSELQEAFA